MLRFLWPWDPLALNTTILKIVNITFSYVRTTLKPPAGKKVMPRSWRARREREGRDEKSSTLCPEFWRNFPKLDIENHLGSNLCFLNVTSIHGPQDSTSLNLLLLSVLVSNGAAPHVPDDRSTGRLSVGPGVQWLPWDWLLSGSSTSKSCPAPSPPHPPHPHPTPTPLHPHHRLFSSLITRPSVSWGSFQSSGLHLNRGWVWYSLNHTLGCKDCSWKRLKPALTQQLSYISGRLKSMDWAKHGDIHCGDWSLSGDLLVMEWMLS